MTLQATTVMVDCVDAAKLARWYVDALGGAVIHDLGVFVITKVDGLPVNLGFQQVPEPSAGKNRIHLDFASDDRAAAVRRFVEHGATQSGDHTFGPLEWTVLRDPEGNEFCVAQQPPS